MPVFFFFSLAVSFLVYSFFFSLSFRFSGVVEPQLLFLQSFYLTLTASGFRKRKQQTNKQTNTPVDAVYLRYSLLWLYYYSFYKHQRKLCGICLHNNWPCVSVFASGIYPYIPFYMYRLLGHTHTVAPQSQCKDLQTHYTLHYSVPPGGSSLQPS